MSTKAYYKRLALTAGRLIKEKGQAVTISTVTPGTYDPTTGKITNTTTTQYGYGIITNWEVKLIDGNLIKVTDKRLYLSPFNKDGAALTAPKIGDTVTDEAGTTYSIVEPINIESPAGVVCMYECNLRA